MTRPPEDQPALWLLQRPKVKSDKPAIWSQALIDNHVAIARSAERPSSTVDGPTFTQLLAALDALTPQQVSADPDLVRVYHAYRALRDRQIFGDR